MIYIWESQFPHLEAGMVRAPPLGLPGGLSEYRCASENGSGHMGHHHQCHHCEEPRFPAELSALQEWQEHHRATGHLLVTSFLRMLAEVPCEVRSGLFCKHALLIVFLGLCPPDTCPSSALAFPGPHCCPLLWAHGHPVGFSCCFSICGLVSLSLAETWK